MAFISNGTTILDNGAFSVSLGSQVLISEQTASSSASVSFTTGIDSTYPIYIFEIINYHSGSQSGIFAGVNFSTDGGSNYNVVKTSTYFRAEHNESGTSSTLTYQETGHLAQSSALQNFANDMSTDNDHNYCGRLILFNPSSTTFVKHFMGVTNSNHPDDKSIQSFIAGYCNTTSAVDGVIFKNNSGNIDSGIFKLYGIKDS
jgi:hypothetical protein